MADLFKKMLPYQSEFSHRFACWANNHMGWAKMKKANKKLTKTRFKRVIQKEIEQELYEYDLVKAGKGEAE